MFILYNLPWDCSNNSCLKFALREQNLSFVNPRSISSQYDFPYTPMGNATFFSIIWHKLLLSSLHLLQFFGSILFPGQMASCTQEATVCQLIWSIGVKLTFFNLVKHSFPRLHLLAAFYIRCNWTQPVLPGGVHFFVFAPQSPQYIVSQCWHFAKVAHNSSPLTQLMPMLMTSCVGIISFRGNRWNIIAFNFWLSEYHMQDFLFLHTHHFVTSLYVTPKFSEGS